jgi:hypothetical protein
MAIRGFLDLVSRAGISPFWSRHPTTMKKATNCIDHLWNYHFNTDHLSLGEYPSLDF